MRKSPTKQTKANSERRSGLRMINSSKSINSGAHPPVNSHHPIQIQLPISPGSAVSPPLSLHKSKLSKSRRLFTEPHEILPLSCKDYSWLILGYIALWTFYACFWYTVWKIYLITAPNDRARYTHNKTDLVTGSPRSSNLLLCDD